jgi:hypothetical protein
MIGSISLKYFVFKYQWFKVTFFIIMSFILWFDLGRVIYNSIASTEAQLLFCSVLAFLLFLLLNHLVYKKSYSFFSLYSSLSKVMPRKIVFIFKINLIGIQFLQIFRNKRLHSQIWQILFIVFFCIYYLVVNKDFSELLLSIYYVILNASLCHTFGQYLFSMDSTIFSAIWTKKINPYMYMKTKFLFLVVLLILTFVIQIPLFIFDYLDKWLSISFSIALLGISVPLIYLSSLIYVKKMDLNKSPFGNWNSVNFFHSLSSMFYTFIPLIIFFIARAFFSKKDSLLFLTSLSVLSMAFFYTYLLIKVFSSFYRYKYNMSKSYLN